MSSQPTHHAKQLVRALFQHAIEAEHLDIPQIARLVSNEYCQNVDGVQLNYPQFIAHLQAQREVVAHMSVDFLALFAEGDRVCSHHQVTIEKKSGATASAEVIAVFTLRDGKIIACDELTRLLHGTESDRDLGSRH